MKKFADDIINLKDLAIGAQIGTGAGGTVFRAKLRRHTEVAVKSVQLPVWPVNFSVLFWFCSDAEHSHCEVTVCIACMHA